MSVVNGDLQGLRLDWLNRIDADFCAAGNIVPSQLRILRLAYFFYMMSPKAVAEL